MEHLTLSSPLSLLGSEDKLENLTLPEYLVQRAVKWAGNKCPYITDVVSGVSYDFSTFEEKTRRVGSALYKKGLRKDGVIIYMTNDLVTLPMFFTAVWRANGTLRASYADDDEDIILERVQESRVQWILCDKEAAETCLSVASRTEWELEVIVMGDYEGCTPFSSLLEDDGDELPPQLLTSGDTAVILSTSGTTGKSKGAVHSHNGLVRSIAAHGAIIPYSSEKPNFLIMNSTHVAAMCFPFSLLITGKTALVIGRRSRTAILSAIQEYRPKTIWGFPPLLFEIVNDPMASQFDLSSLEIAITGGAVVSPAISKSLMQLPNLKYVHNVYGCTEGGPLCGTMNFEDGNSPYNDAPTFTIGKVLPGVSVQVRDEENHNILGPNRLGQIHVKSVYLFSGYFNNEKTTNETLKDGWFGTGDMGYYDENGFVIIVDRMKEVFKVRGDNSHINQQVSPTEVEDVINRHPDVAQSCVIGIPDPNGFYSLPRAFVTIKKGGKGTVEEIAQFANDKLPNYKRLRGGLYILQELPKGKSGKVSRNLLAELNPDTLTTFVRD